MVLLNNEGFVIDYINSKPWNDPFNPWPSYTQIALSGQVIGEYTSNSYNVNLILSMYWFAPTALLGPFFATVQVAYAHEINDNYNIYLEYLGYRPNTPGGPSFNNAWALAIEWWVEPGLVDYFSMLYYPTQNITKNVPYIYKPGTGAAAIWTDYLGSGKNNLIITPVLSSIAPWERRRIIGGTG